jgi:hypothetical protein
MTNSMLGVIIPKTNPILSADSKEKLIDFELKLKQISDSMLDGSSPKIRVDALKTFVPLLRAAIKVPGSFAYPFDSLKFLKRLTPEDNSFRLFNWMLKFDDGTFKYFAAIQYNHPDSLKLIPFFDVSTRIDSNIDDAIMSPKNWYGALYSTIHQCKIKNKDYYMLLGWNAENIYSDKKVIEVITFDKKDGILLGAPIFDWDGKIKKRITFLYNGKANMLLNYLPDQNVFSFDHLSAENPDTEGKPWTYMPDGQFNYLSFKKGKWKLKENLFEHTKTPIKEAGE